jgi:hypothetical protein
MDIKHKKASVATSFKQAMDPKTGWAALAYGHGHLPNAGIKSNGLFSKSMTKHAKMEGSAIKPGQVFALRAGVIASNVLTLGLVNVGFSIAGVALRHSKNNADAKAKAFNQKVPMIRNEIKNTSAQFGLAGFEDQTILMIKYSLGLTKSPPAEWLLGQQVAKKGRPDEAKELLAYNFYVGYTAFEEAIVPVLEDSDAN